MKEFLVRLTNVIHWICFLATLSMPPVFCFGYLYDVYLLNLYDFSWFELEMMILTSLMVSAGFILGGWVLKYLLTGRMGFFPWMTK